jgi:hypothetical protein
MEKDEAQLSSIGAHPLLHAGSTLPYPSSAQINGAQQEQDLVAHPSLGTHPRWASSWCHQDRYQSGESLWQPVLWVSCLKHPDMQLFSTAMPCKLDNHVAFLQVDEKPGSAVPMRKLIKGIALGMYASIFVVG